MSSGGLDINIILPDIPFIDSRIDGLLWRIGKLAYGDNVVLDFSQIKFIKPQTIVLLLIACERIYNITFRDVEWVGLSDDSLGYLERVNMKNIPFISFKTVSRKAKWFRSEKESINLMELTKITAPAQSADARKRTRNILANWFPEKVKGGYCNQVAGMINEIIDNSLEHSLLQGEAFCYFILQKYQYHDHPTKVVIALGDGGIGIRNSLKNAHTWIKERDTLAIKNALIDGISGRKDQAGGLGFRAVSKTLREFGGTIAIRSGQGSIRYTPKNGECVSIEHKWAFPGTQTSFIL